MDETWDDDVQADALGRVNDGRDAREGDDGGFGRGVGDLRFADVAQGGDGCDVYDGSGCGREG